MTVTKITKEIAIVIKLLCSMSMALTLRKELTGCDWLMDANILMTINLTQFEVIHINYIHINFVI